MIVNQSHWWFNVEIINFHQHAKRTHNNYFVTAVAAIFTPHSIIQITLRERIFSVCQLLHWISFDWNIIKINDSKEAAATASVKTEPIIDPGKITPNNATAIEIWYHGRDYSLTFQIITINTMCQLSGDAFALNENVKNLRFFFLLSRNHETHLFKTISKCVEHFVAFPNNAPKI